MKYILLISIFILTAFSSAVFGLTIQGSDGQPYNGEMIIQDVGSMLVVNGQVDLGVLEKDVKGFPAFIPVSEINNSYLFSVPGMDETITLPRHVSYNKNFALYNVVLDMVDSNEIIATAYFHNSSSMEHLVHTSLVLPYLTGKTAKMVFVRGDNFHVLEFNLPENPKEKIDIGIVPWVPLVDNPRFFVEIHNKYMKLEDPKITKTDNGLRLVDKGTGADIELYLPITLTKFVFTYQNVVYELEVDNPMNTLRATKRVVEKEDLSTFRCFDYQTHSLLVTSKLKLTPVTKLEEAKKQEAKIHKEKVAKANQPGAGLGYYAAFILIFSVTVGYLIWFFTTRKDILNSAIKDAADATSRIIWESKFQAIIDYTGDKWFLDNLIKSGSYKDIPGVLSKKMEEVLSVMQDLNKKAETLQKKRKKVQEVFDKVMRATNRANEVSGASKNASADYQMILSEHKDGLYKIKKALESRSNTYNTSIMLVCAKFLELNDILKRLNANAEISQLKRQSIDELNEIIDASMDLGNDKKWDDVSDLTQAEDVTNLDKFETELEEAIVEGSEVEEIIKKLGQTL